MVINCYNCQSVFTYDYELASYGCCPECGKFFDESIIAEVLADALANGKKIGCVHEGSKPDRAELHLLLSKTIGELHNAGLILYEDEHNSN
jgi:protein-arginine kinase activator protein McsA